MTRFSEINIKAYQMLAGPMSYSTARKRYAAIKDCLDVPHILVFHLADYLGVSTSEIIEGILPPKKIKSV